MDCEVVVALDPLALMVPAAALRSSLGDTSHLLNLGAKVLARNHGRVFGRVLFIGARWNALDHCVVIRVVKVND